MTGHYDNTTNNCNYIWGGLYLWWTSYCIIDMIKNSPNIKTSTLVWIITHLFIFIIAAVIITIIAINQ